MITENLSTLKIHKLSQAQYERELEAGNLDESALYLTPDTNDVIPIEQGGTGATTAADARKALEAASKSDLTTVALELVHHFDDANPHNITCNKIGAAASSHTHTADQVEGTVKVQKGGYAMSNSIYLGYGDYTPGLWLFIAVGNAIGINGRNTTTSSHSGVGMGFSSGKCLFAYVLEDSADRAEMYDIINNKTYVVELSSDGTTYNHTTT